MKQRTGKADHAQKARRPISSPLALALALIISLGSVLPVTADSVSKSAARRLTEDQKLIHVLNRLGFGPRPGDLERVRRMGLDKYIEQQLNPSGIDDLAVEARLKEFGSLNMTVAQIYDKYPQPQEVLQKLGLDRPGQQANPNNGEPRDAQQEQRRKVLSYYMENGLKPPNTLLQELQAQKLIRAAYSERQLQEVMTDFWFNHFNIFWAKGADRWLTSDFEMKAIRPNTLGKFKDLLLATAKSPAMLFYLDNFQSMAPDAEPPFMRRMNRREELQRRPQQPGNRPPDNQRNRQLMQQPELMPNQEMRRPEQPGGQQMNPPGQTEEQRRAQQALNDFRNRKRGINENYAREIMELHTLGVDGGYAQKDVQEVARAFTGWTIEQPRQSGTFVFRDWMHDQGEKIVLGQKIPAGGGIEDGYKVIEILANHPNTARFVSTKLVRRFVSDNPPKSLVDRVVSTYSKTGGDIREMLRTLFTSPEFFAPENYRAKIKSPFELAVSAIRALGGDTVGGLQLAQFVGKMGQPLYLYQAPTGYPDRAEQWVNTGALLERLNFGLAISSNRVAGTKIDLKRLAPEMEGKPSLQVMEQAIALLLNGDVSPQTRQILNKQLKEGVPVTGELGHVPANMAQAGDELTVRDSMNAGNLRQNRKGEFVERRPRQGEGRGQMMPPSGPPSPPEIAQVFGLVLGSPEFQRR